MPELLVLSRREKEALLAEKERRLTVQHDHAQDFCAWVEDVIYPYHPENRKQGGHWRLGKMHKEVWAPRLNQQRSLQLGPRAHLKTFFFAESYPLHRCIFNAPDEWRIFLETDGQAYERLDHIKSYILNTPSLRYLAGKGSRLWNRGEIVLANGSRIKAQGFWSKTRGGHANLVLDDIISIAVLYSDMLNQKAKERLRLEILPQALAHHQTIVVGTLQREDDVYASLPDGLYNPLVQDAIVDEEKQQVLWPEGWPWDALMAKKTELD